MVICGSPSVASTFISATPGTVAMILPISSALLASTSKSSPNNLMATSSRTPVSSSLKRISIGWVNSKLTPGTILMASFIFSTSSSLLSADTHSSVGLRMTKTSAISIGIGSVGTSATPIRLRTVSTSGNSALTMRSILVVVSMVSESKLPGFKMAWKAMSPSSNCGMNSPPILVKTNMVTAKRASAIPTTIFPFESAFVSKGSYFLSIQCTNLSP